MKKGQAWGFDLSIAGAIFIAGMVTFYFFAVNTPSNGETNIDQLAYEGKVVADSLLSEGSPSNWNITTVYKIGILTEGKINDTKLSSFYAASQTQYQATKPLLGTKFDYFINFSEPIIINSAAVGGIGHEPVNTDNVLKISRFAVYNNKPISVEVLVWKPND